MDLNQQKRRVFRQALGTVFRVWITCVIGGGIALAQPESTRIADTVYLADGIAFDGYVQFEWRSFVTPKAPVAPNSKLVRVVQGALAVDLAPTVGLGYTAYYRVRYFSHGRVRYTEYWDVPASASPLTIAGVRMQGAPAAGAGSGGPGVALPITQEDVSGLTTDLEDRPVKGPNFLPSRTVFVNTDGVLESISGAPTDCVRVDGTSVPCGESASYLVDGEIPQGIVNAANTIFTLNGAPTPPESLLVFRNGVLQRQGIDFTLNGNTLQFLLAAIPQPGDVLLTYYRTFQTTGAPVSGAGLLPQVLCSKAGGSTSSLTTETLGSCTLGGSLLFPGDRLEIQLDWALTGTVADAFGVEVMWAGTPIFTRSFQAGDTTATGSVRVSVGDSTRQFSLQSHGALSPLAVSTGTLDIPQSAFHVLFGGRVNENQEAALTLTSYTVIRYPNVNAQ